MTGIESRTKYAKFQSQLKLRQNELRAAIQAALLRSDAETYGALAGHVHDVEEESLGDLLNDLNLAEISREVQEVQDIDLALGRINAQTYGVCIQCGNEISPDRLEAYPTAKRCVVCQRIYESRIPARPPAKL